MLRSADSLPGPVLQAELGDDIEITVNNLAELQTVDIHWHGMPQVDFKLKLMLVTYALPFHCSATPLASLAASEPDFFSKDP